MRRWSGRSHNWRRRICVGPGRLLSRYQGRASIPITGSCTTSRGAYSGGRCCTARTGSCGIAGILSISMTFCRAPMASLSTAGVVVCWNSLHRLRWRPNGICHSMRSCMPSAMQKCARMSQCLREMLGRLLVGVRRRRMNCAAFNEYCHE
jgi:hypothetical protein